MCLPLIATGLPRDQFGCCVVPHPHPLKRRRAKGRKYLDARGRIAHRTDRACDNCDAQITEIVWYTCAEGCTVDFCQACNQRLETLFVDIDREHVGWVVDFVPRLAMYVLSGLGAAARQALARELAFAFPDELFAELVQAVVDVANAKVVHMEDNCEGVQRDVAFWSTVGLLQLLYAANLMHASGCPLGEVTPRGPKIPLSRFAVRGIDKCDAEFEWERWAELLPEDGSDPTPRADAWETVLETEDLEVTGPFATFLSHGNLVPASFWSRCLQLDVFHALLDSGGFDARRRRIRHLQISICREKGFLESVLHAFGRADTQALLSRPLSVTFINEEASGPGVTREFLQLAIQVVVETAAAGRPRRRDGEPRAGTSAEGAETLWECDPDLRTYWFRAPGDPGWPEAFRSLGALLGHTMLSKNVLPVAFPPALFRMLLEGAGSKRPRVEPTLSDLASVCPAMARSLEKLLEYDGDDVAELFTLEWPGSAGLTPSTRAEYVAAYVRWYFTERYAEQVAPMVEGFRRVVGNSRLLKTLVGPSQLEQILCGVEAPVDTDAIQSGAVAEDWGKGDGPYLDVFWGVLGGLTPDEKRRFVTFVSSCGRMPPRGWQDLGLRVQWSSGADERLPTAFTCFNLLMLPKYSTAEVLRDRLRTAILDTEGFGLG